jgi:hypothetical protein
MGSIRAALSRSCVRSCESKIEAMKTIPDLGTCSIKPRTAQAGTRLCALLIAGLQGAAASRWMFDKHVDSHYSTKACLPALTKKRRPARLFHGLLTQARNLPVLLSLQRSASVYSGLRFDEETRAATPVPAAHHALRAFFVFRITQILSRSLVRK